MKKKLYEYLVNDCIRILLRDNWDSPINRVLVVMNLMMIHMYIKPVQIVDSHLIEIMTASINNEL